MTVKSRPAELSVPVGGFSDEPRTDVIVQENGQWSVYSEGSLRKRLGGPYKTRSEALKRLREVEYFKSQDGTYIPPPGQGTAPGNHTTVEPGPSAAPDPHTRPTLSSGRSDAKKRRRKRLPKQIPPTRLEEDYANALIRVIKKARHAWAPVIRALPNLITDAATERGDSGRLDGSKRLDAGESKKLRHMIQVAVNATRQAISQSDLDALARKFAERTSTYQRLQLANQVRGALGADPIFRDKGMVARIEQFTHENVALITRIPERLHGDLETLITRAVSRGQLSDSLSEEIENRFGISERHARLIARDQIGSFYANVNHARQKDLGVTKAVWQTVSDERVRPEHAAMDGVEFSYDNPPHVEGDKVLPGEPIQCRCWSSPVMDSILDE